MKNSGYAYRGKEGPNLTVSLLRDESYPRAISGSMCECGVFTSV